MRLLITQCAWLLQDGSTFADPPPIPEFLPVETLDGCYLSDRIPAVVRLGGRSCERLRQTRRHVMTGMYLLAGLIAAGLLVYLVLALLKAEDL